MAKSFRVVDLRADSSGIDLGLVDGVQSPEVAALKVMGVDLVRSGARSDLVAKVYFKNKEAESLNMVRLYRRVEHRPR